MHGNTKHSDVRCYIGLDMAMLHVAFQLHWDTILWISSLHATTATTTGRDGRKSIGAGLLVWPWSLEQHRSSTGTFLVGYMASRYFHQGTQRYCWDVSTCPGTRMVQVGNNKCRLFYRLSSMDWQNCSFFALHCAHWTSIKHSYRHLPSVKIRLPIDYVPCDDVSLIATRKPMRQYPLKAGHSMG